MARLRKMPIGDVTTEWAYYDAELTRAGELLIGADDSTEVSFCGFMVPEYRQKRDICADELHRRERLEKENRQDAETVGDSQNDSAMMKETLHVSFYYE